MRIYTLAAAFSLILGSTMVMAAEADRGGSGDQDCPSCHDKTKKVCMNLKCDYKFKKDDRDYHCAAVSKFYKRVTEDGGEVADNSDSDDDVKMEIACEGLPVWNDPARRYTDLLGTRIQGQQGPDPAILLPRGALHSNEEGEGAGHYSHSILEFQTNYGFERAHGQCFIWSGKP